VPQVPGCCESEPVLSLIWKTDCAGIHITGAKSFVPPSPTVEETLINLSIAPDLGAPRCACVYANALAVPGAETNTTSTPGEQHAARSDGAIEDASLGLLRRVVEALGGKRNDGAGVTACAVFASWHYTEFSGTAGQGPPSTVLGV
jgi:hypothetical protein